MVSEQNPRIRINGFEQKAYKYLKKTLKQTENNDRKGYFAGVKNMTKLLKGLGIIIGIIVIFMFITACAPNKSSLKNEPSPMTVSDTKPQGNSPNEESFNLDEIGSNYENDNNKPESDPRLDEYSKRDNSDDIAVAGFSDPNDQTGLASWYGREFHGRKTASGESFDMYDMTAAHRTYPFGTVLLVKNVENGKSVKVKINDRGPYVERRVIDLSYAAARNIGILAKGEAMVSIKVISMGKNNKKNTPSVASVSGPADTEDYDTVPAPIKTEPIADGNFEIQAGAFYSKKNADKLKEQIADIVDNEVIVVKDGDYYKVRVTNINSKKTANKYKKALSEESISCVIIEKD